MKPVGTFFKGLGDKGEKVIETVYGDIKSAVTRSGDIIESGEHDISGAVQGGLGTMKWGIVVGGAVLVVLFLNAGAVRGLMN